MILGQRPTRWHLVSLLMTFVGVIFTTDLQEIILGRLSPLGVGLAVVATIANGLYMVQGEMIGSGVSGITKSLWTRVAVIGLTLVLHPQVLGEVLQVSWQGWVLSLVTALVAGVVSYLFLNWGVVLIGANRAAVTSVAEIPIALALGRIFEGDMIRPLQGLGAALIAAAMVIYSLAAGEDQTEEQDFEEGEILSAEDRCGT